MRETNEHGYTTAIVNGKELTMKKTQAGTDLSAAARRLLAYENVRKVRIEYDGEFQFTAVENNSTTLAQYVPDGYSIENVMVHESGNAHVWCDEA